MEKKPIVSITYERTSIKNSLPYIKCVLHVSCVVRGPIYDHFTGCTVNGLGHPTTNVSKYARSVSDGFLCALEACLVNLELP